MTSNDWLIVTRFKKTLSLRFEIRTLCPDEMHTELNPDIKLRFINVIFNDMNDMNKL